MRLADRLEMLQAFAALQPAEYVHFFLQPVGRYEYRDRLTATHDNSVWVNNGEALDILKNGRVDAIRIGRR
jgi:hypothetical protein